MSRVISDTVKWVYLQFIIRPLLLSALFIIIWSSTPCRIGLFPPSQYFGHADKKLGVMSLSDSIEEGGGWCFGGRQWFRSITWFNRKKIRSPLFTNDPHSNIRHHRTLLKMFVHCHNNPLTKATHPSMHDFRYIACR